MKKNKDIIEFNSETMQLTHEAVENLPIHVYENKKGEKLICLIAGSNFKFPFALNRCRKYITDFKSLFGKIKREK